MSHLLCVLKVTTTKPITDRITTTTIVSTSMTTTTIGSFANAARSSRRSNSFHDDDDDFDVDDDDDDETNDEKDKRRSSKSTKKSGVRRRILTGQMGTIFGNGLLVLFTGAPIKTVRTAMSELRDCVSKSYDETMQMCVLDAGHAVAAGLLVLSDWRTWLWPPDAEVFDIDDVVADVISRRLRPRVREDQCGRSEKPGSGGGSGKEEEGEKEGKKEGDGMGR